MGSWTNLPALLGWLRWIKAASAPLTLTRMVSEVRGKLNQARLKPVPAEGGARHYLEVGYLVRSVKLSTLPVVTGRAALSDASNRVQSLIRGRWAARNNWAYSFDLW